MNTSKLVWDDSRVRECADVAARAVIDFLEQFNEPDSETVNRVAFGVEHVVELHLNGMEWGEPQAIAKAKELFPRGGFKNGLINWNTAYPILPTPTSRIDSAAWMVTSSDEPDICAMVDTQGGNLLEVRQRV